MQARLWGVLAITGAALGLVFWRWPGIDLGVSAQVFDAEAGIFPLAATPWAVLLREGARGVMHGVAGGLLVVTLWALVRGDGALRRRSVYAATLTVLGPGLIVNGGFKEMVGRARPDEITAFGGSASFTGAWDWTATACATNCSFPSGEAAGAAAAAIVLAVFVRPLPLRLVFAAYALFTAAWRVALGRHYLSDVLVSLWIVAALALLLAPLLHRVRQDAARA